MMAVSWWPVPERSRAALRRGQLPPAVWRVRNWPSAEGRQKDSGGPGLESQLCCFPAHHALFDPNFLICQRGMITVKLYLLTFMEHLVLQGINLFNSQKSVLQLHLAVNRGGLRHQVGLGDWLISVISATQEVEIENIKVGGQPGQKVSEIPSGQMSWV
jgi:hypothetical protein